MIYALLKNDTFVRLTDRVGDPNPNKGFVFYPVEYVDVPHDSAATPRLQAGKWLIPRRGPAPPSPNDVLRARIGDIVNALVVVIDQIEAAVPAGSITPAMTTLIQRRQGIA